MTDPDVDDAALVARARAGDDAAFDCLVRRHEVAAWALARSLVHDRAEAEDLVQDAFVRAHANLVLLADPARFGPWLRRVVFGVCIDWLRAFRPERWRVGDRADGDGELPDVADAAPDPLTRLERDELAARVSAAVHALPERYRVPLVLYHLDGVSHARVAESLGVPVGTARSLVTRARRRLRALLAPYAEEHLPMSDTADRPDDVFDERPVPAMLHVLNGDATRVLLEQSGVPGTMAVWADVLHDGPVPPPEAGDADVREVRARFIAEQGWGTREEALATLARWDAAVARWPEYDEVVIWCEHDLFDQLLLVRHLAWLSDRGAGDGRLSLICVGEWPGRPAFMGLGELAPSELASLLGTRQRVTQRQLALGRRAWRAFTAADPRAVERFLAEEDAAALPFLADALRRHLEEFPSTRDGLARTERQILELLADGERRLADAFRAHNARERVFYLGDVSFIARLRRLAAGANALVALDEGSPPCWETGVASLTPAGRAVLAGRADRVRLLGVDEWRGGVRLRGPEAEWRWDPDARRLRRATGVAAL